MLVCVGVITGVKGVRGLLKVKSFTQHPEDLLAYGPLLTHNGEKSYTLKLAEKPASDLLIVSCENITDRTQAEKLRGTELYLSRNTFPQLDEEEFYYVDLIGLTAIDETETKVGSVIAVQNYGAGVFLELQDSENNILTVPFSHDAVPQVDLPQKTLVVIRRFILDSQDTKQETPE